MSHAFLGIKTCRDTAWVHDALNRLSAITYPSGRKLVYSYDSAGRVSRIDTVQGSTTQTLVRNVQYQPFGGLKGYSYGNSGSYTRHYDQDGRVTHATLGNVTRSLGYDAAGRITASADYPAATPNTPTNVQIYGYDRLDRLTGWTAPGSNQGYAYDANGNRTALTIGANQYAYTIATGSNRLTAVAGPLPARSYTFDANGSPTGDGINQFGYDGRGRLVQAVTPGGTVSYGINALGQRVIKTAGTVTTHYHYDASGRLIAENDAAGGNRSEYVYLGATPVAVIRGGQAYMIHTDHLDTPRRVTDQNSAPVWNWSSTDPFGATPPDETPGGSRFVFNLRFPGQYFDKETGLAYNYFRDYDPGTGRYVESDPIGLAGGINTYAYVEGNPVSFVDPTGEIAFVPILMGIG
ncbi:MAG: RHS repeat protein, partial [Methylobacterium sp.]|nr:RHS repeat protein [Methylobacterium sp.]